MSRILRPTPKLEWTAIARDIESGGDLAIAAFRAVMANHVDTLAEKTLKGGTPGDLARVQNVLESFEAVEKALVNAMSNQDAEKNPDAYISRGDGSLPDNYYIHHADLETPAKETKQ